MLLSASDGEKESLKILTSLFVPKQCYWWKPYLKVQSPLRVHLPSSELLVCFLNHPSKHTPESGGSLPAWKVSAPAPRPSSALWELLQQKSRWQSFSCINHNDFNALWKPAFKYKYQMAIDKKLWIIYPRLQKILTLYKKPKKTKQTNNNFLDYL